MKKNSSIHSPTVGGENPNPGRFGRVLATLFITGIVIFLLILLRNIHVI